MIWQPRNCFASKLAAHCFISGAGRPAQEPTLNPKIGIICVAKLGMASCIVRHLFVRFLPFALVVFVCRSVCHFCHSGFGCREHCHLFVIVFVILVGRGGSEIGHQTEICTLPEASSVFGNVRVVFCDFGGARRREGHQTEIYTLLEALSLVYHFRGTWREGEGQKRLKNDNRENHQITNK